MPAPSLPGSHLPSGWSQPSPPIPDILKAGPAGRLKAECLLQVGTAIMVDNLPEMQAAVIEQGQEAALVGKQRPKLG
jgi:hypothetical protein